MNQALADLVNGWLESNDPFKKSPQQNGTPASLRGKTKNKVEG